MRVFVCETVSGGDYAGTDLPETLIAEGAMMRDALIADLEDLPGVRVFTTHDARLPAPPCGESRAIGPGEDTRAIWSELAAQTDCCWPIAPECEGILHSLVEQLGARNRRVIACDVETLQTCSSKLRTATHLAAAGIPFVPSWSPSTVPAGLSGPLVIKPDDGAGAMDVHVFRRLPPGPYPTGVVIQPFIVGTAASLTLLCQSGRAQVLTANRQHVVEADGQLLFRGLTVGAFPVDDTLRALADAIGAALPGLHGILGVDYIATPSGPVVVEINPRLTTAYVGLRRALGINPLAFVAELVQDGMVPDMNSLPPSHPVEISL
ncbi:ATP-grasp domain-containing protein [Ancylobacter sp. WKF20]|uniref:ATP-grasp domain-containing protein n=1 Tax=Ancylobacter sp. WKF20 TaxID=3039801 RepID=UPI0024342D1F|nr:ATP-grasp domain-containing protein [Ancylobacter sp. WKF20]WGD30426.1 ATP-grasp domain-containing protein [Ancylobacter sp. WKF20]